MGWQSTPYTVPLVATAVVSGALLLVASRGHEDRTAVPLMGVLAATAF